MALQPLQFHAGAALRGGIGCLRVYVYTAIRSWVTQAWMWDCSPVRPICDALRSSRLVLSHQGRSHFSPIAIASRQLDFIERGQAVCSLFYFADFGCSVRQLHFYSFYPIRHICPAKVPKSQSPRGWDSSMLLLIISELPLFPLFI